MELSAQLSGGILGFLPHFLLFCPIFTRSSAADAFENAVKVAYTAKSAFSAYLCYIGALVAQQAAGFFKAKKIDKRLEIHAKALVEKGGKIVVFIPQSIRHLFHRKLAFHILRYQVGHLVSEFVVGARIGRYSVLYTFVANKIQTRNVQKMLGRFGNEKIFFKNFFYFVVASEF